MITQLTPSGLPGRRYGSFAGREAADEPVVEQGQAPTTGGGGGVANWPGRSEFGWEKWRRKEDKRLARLKKQKAEAERKVEALQKEVKATRNEASRVRTLEAVQRLVAELERIQRELNKAQSILDELEMQEVALVWASWNRAN